MVRKRLLARLVRLIWGDWQANDLWQRIVKCLIACIAALTVAIHPAVIAVFGTSTFLTIQTVVFAHPGQRMGLMIESLLMIVLGAMSGLAWSLFGLYLSSLVVEANQPAAFTVRAIFLLVATLFHGFVRSASPRLFLFVLLMLVASIQVLVGPSAVVTRDVFTNVAYPILAGAAILLTVNLGIFPELSSSFLGSSAIDTLSQTMDTLTQATHWFVTPGGDQQPEPEETGTQPTLARMRTMAPLKQETPQKTGRWRRFLEDFPNPFHSARNQLPVSHLPPQLTKLASLTDRKTKLRAQMQRCKTAQDEVNFEISISSLPPMSMKPITTQYMSALVQNTITLVGACENKFVVLGNHDHRHAEADEDSSDTHEPTSASDVEPSSHVDSKDKPHSPDPRFWQHSRSRAVEPPSKLAEAGVAQKGHLKRVDDVKPLRELQSSNAELLESILAHLREPVQQFETSLQQTVAVTTSCLAYCFDVTHLPCGAPAPKGVQLEEIDLWIDIFADALEKFDTRTSKELRRAATKDEQGGADLMPRMEMFLVSSFLLGLRQAAVHILQMLRHSRRMVEERQRRHDRLRIWLPQYESLRQWLSTGGEADVSVLPDTAKKSARTGKGDKVESYTDTDQLSDDKPLLQRPTDEECGLTTKEEEPQSEKRPQPTKSKVKKSKKQTLAQDRFTLKLRGLVADAMEWALDSDDLAYALKLAVAVFLVTWPAFVTSWSAWYAEIRGSWAPVQLILVFEVVIGSSLFIFFVRLFGVVFGCTMGYLAYVIGGGNRAAMVAVLFFGVLPSIYIQLATKYVKAGMIAIISMTVVALATVNLSGTGVENFYTRLGTFVVGGTVAMVVEIGLYPVRARDRLVECLSSCVKQVQNMQAALAVGIDHPDKPNFRSVDLDVRFKGARDKAEAALRAAETFLPFCLTEPRMKGSFKKLAPIYREIIYVLHQIIDRMENTVQLRHAYGSSILEDLNPQVYTYRRNVAAGAMLTLFSVHEALTTWLPLPQFIPSTRLAQNRLVSRVRDVVDSRGSANQDDIGKSMGAGEDEQTTDVITQHKFLSWNANAAGQMEIIEYLEELVELTKLLVGVNAFRSGILEKPNYKQYVEDIKTSGEALNRVRSPQADADGQGDGTGQVDGLRRAVVVARGVDRFKARLRKNESTDAEERRQQLPSVSEEDREALPRSLQRVGTRLWQEGASPRRRGNAGAG